MTRTEGIVSRVFHESIERNGYIHPREVTEHVLFESRIDCPQTYETIESIIRYSPTYDYLYQDVFPFFEDVLANPQNRIDIWTDDYLDRIASSGIGEFRRRLPSQVRSRLGVLSDREDKKRRLDEVFDSVKNGKYEHIVIVDDKELNLDGARKKAEKGGIVSKCEFVLMDRRGDTSLNGFVHVNELDAYPLRLYGNTRVLVDFNGVCIDEKAYGQSRKRSVAGLLEDSM